MNRYEVNAPHQTNGTVGLEKTQKLNANELFGLDFDLNAKRAQMSEKDKMKLEAIEEVAAERVDYRSREHARTFEYRASKEEVRLFGKLKADGLKSDPALLRKEAESNIAKWDSKEIDRIKRETRVQIDRHLERALGERQSKTQQRSQ